MTRAGSPVTTTVVTVTPAAFALRARKPQTVPGEGVEHVEDPCWSAGSAREPDALETDRVGKDESRFGEARETGRAVEQDRRASVQVQSDDDGGRGPGNTRRHASAEQGACP